MDYRLAWLFLNFSLKKVFRFGELAKSPQGSFEIGEDGVGI